RSGAFALSPQRAALWLEEREPALRYALVTAAEGDVSQAARAGLEASIASVAWEEPARRALARSLRLPALVAAGGAALALVLPARAGVTSAATGEAGAAGREAATPATLGTVAVRVSPPRYTAR